MRENHSRLLAWLLCAFCVISPSIQVIIWLGGLTARPSLFDVSQRFFWGWALPIVFSVVGALIVARRPGNRVGWLLMLPALTVAIPVESIVSNLSPVQTAVTPALWLLLWLNGWSWIPVIFAVMLIPLHFPTGRPPSPRWEWVNRLAIGMWVVFMVVSGFSEQMVALNQDWTVPNPIGFLSQAALNVIFGVVWSLGLLVLVSSSVVSLFARYRRAGYRERQQIKWLLYAGALFAVVYSAAVFLAESDARLDWFDLLFASSLLALPIAIGFAILRHRLYDIDVIIRKTLLYAVLSGMLALVYFGSVVLLQSLVGQVGAEQSPLIIVVSTLLIAALFAPLRQRVQTFIDRRFYRRRYVSQQVLAQFAQTARDEVSLEALTAELARVVQEAMQPETTHVWVKPVIQQRVEAQREVW